MKKVGIIIALAMFVVASQSWAAKKAKTVTLPTALEAIEKVNDHYQATNAPEVNAFWDNAVYFTGNMEAYMLTGKAAYLEYSDKWARHNKWSGATEPNHRKWQYKTYGEGPEHVLFGDWQNCFRTYAMMYEMNPDDYKLTRAREVMEHILNMDAKDLWWWSDALYMAMPVMSKMFKVTGDKRYLDRLTELFAHADGIMYDKEEGLYYRDAKYVYPNHKTDAGKKDFWARGDGWVLAGLAQVLADTPEDWSGRELLVERFKAVAKAAAACQTEEGYWTRSLLDVEQSAGKETSGTALFTYGILWGVNNGLLDKSEYENTITKAWTYLAGTALQEDGSVGYVQPIGEKATGGDLTAANVTNFGTGAFLLAACEKVRYDDNSVSPAEDMAFVVKVTNSGKAVRKEVIELDAAKVFEKLGISGGRQFKVLNAVGQQIAYQLTYDGKLLIEVSVRPGGTAEYVIKKGLPQTFVNTCYGRMYPERVDDIAWENDRCAYRLYGPALQASGEDAYGIDVWVKNTPDLDVEKRYFIEDVNKPVIAALKQSDPAMAEKVNMLTSYHYDQGYGLDCYKVGPTLGCGTPALLDGDNIIFPYCWKEYELLDNGPLRFTVSLTYNPATIKGQEGIIEHRLLSIDKGTNFNRMTVWYDGLTAAVDLASGVVIHTEDTQSVVLGENYVQYADPTDNPDGQNFQIYVAALFPNGVSQTKTLMYDNPTRGNAGHALGIVKDYDGSKYTYYFGSAWSKYDCFSQDEWQLRVKAKLDALANPLTIE